MTPSVPTRRSSELAQEGLRIVTPDARTSGGGRWNLCAVYGAALRGNGQGAAGDRKSTRLNSSHQCASRMPSSAGQTTMYIDANIAHLQYMNLTLNHTYTYCPYTTHLFVIK